MNKYTIAIALASRTVCVEIWAPSRKQAIRRSRLIDIDERVFKRTIILTTPQGV